MKFAAASLLATTIAAQAMVGTNIGGLFVLEPWITPSFFYRFLEQTAGNVGVDSFSVCQALGPEEGNSMMRAHWDSWITEEHLAGLAARDVEIIRLPIGDWTFTQYGPYIGCMDGAKEKIDWVLDTAAKYNIKVLIDVHAVKDSQNGFDNSGKASGFEWIDENHFKHWSIQNASWLGHFNGTEYDVINYDNVAWSVNVIRDIMNAWGHHPAVYAVEPVNEPWEKSDFPTLKSFYRQVRAVIREINPEVKFVFHDAFTPRADHWNDLFADDDIENTIMDTHAYMAWYDKMDTVGEYCDKYKSVLLDEQIRTIKYPIWVGEWSLATDACATWLGGFNDHNTVFQFECNWVDCPTTYLPSPYNKDFDRSAAILGPFGEMDESCIRNGKCPIDSMWFSDAEVQKLASCAGEVFNNNYAGQFLWNFRNELEPRWSYVEAYDQGWIDFKSQKEFLS